MTKYAIGVSFALFILMGSGCVTRMMPVPTPSSTSTIPSGSGTVPISTAATSTAPSAPHPDWQLDLFPDMTFLHPGTSTPVDPHDEQAGRGLILTVDLGTAVKNPGTKSVPDRTLGVWRLKPGNPQLNACRSKSMNREDVLKTTFIETRFKKLLCLVESADAGAGNYYVNHAYYLPVGDAGGYEFVFTVHSVQCANFEHPAEQCVAYDEVRDTGLFRDIIETIQLPKTDGL